MWSMSEGTFVLELSIDSLQSDQNLVDKVVEPMQSLVNPTLPSESEVIESMQSLTDPISPLETDAHVPEVFCITSLDVSKKGDTLSVPCEPLPSPRIISFEWNSLAEPRLPSLTPF